MRNFEIGSVVYFDKTQKAIVESINDDNQTARLKWFFLEDTYFYTGELNTVKKSFKEISLEFNGN